jgi:hypothetical protein
VCYLLEPGRITSIELPATPFRVDNFRLGPPATPPNCGGVAAEPGGIPEGNCFFFDILFVPQSPGTFSGAVTLHYEAVTPPISPLFGTWQLFGESFQPFEVCFYAKRPSFVQDDKSIVGHAFLELITRVSTLPRDEFRQSYGKYADSLNFFDGAGTVRNDQATDWDWRICYPLSPLAYERIAAKIFQKLPPANPGYQLLTFNCVDWVVAAADAAGLTLPNTVWLTVQQPSPAEEIEIDSPWTFADALETIGEDGTFAGGTVQANPDPRHPSRGTEPLDIDVAALSVIGHQDPQFLATAMGLPLNQPILGQVPVHSDDALTIELQNLAVETAMISIDWGDGGPFQIQATQAQHPYPEPGPYQGSILIIDEGTVHAYTLDIQVGPDQTTQHLTLTIPTPIPSTTPNPGNENPPLPNTPIIEPKDLYPY